MANAANAVAMNGTRTATSLFFRGSREYPAYGPCPGSHDYIKRATDTQDLKSTTECGDPTTITLGSQSDAPG